MTMARQDANQAFAATSFLYGANAAYIEELQARFARDPASVDGGWRAFFEGLKDEPKTVIADADGPAWRQKNWPIVANGELVSALDGNWAALEKELGGKIKAVAQKRGVGFTEAEVHQATRDSVRALMMIRAYRMRGHFHANLDPLGLQTVENPNELEPASYGFTEADLDRKIFIDNVLGLEFATVREMVAILKRTYCSTLGIEFMHISDPAEKSWIQERIEGVDKGIAFTPEGKKA